MKQSAFLYLTCIILILCLSSVSGFFTNAPLPPSQPVEGPGSTEYAHDRVLIHRYGWNGKRYWIFEPAEPTPDSAPVIIFNHGWSAINPVFYETWIHHIVKRGNIVIYPRYQAGLVIGFWRFYENALDAVLNAEHELSQPGHVTPEWHNLAVVGHSLGGGISMYLASQLPSLGFPPPKAVMPVQPGLVPWETINYSTIDNETYLLVIVGENDTIVGNESGKTIFYETPQIPLENKDYIVQRTDEYGEPDLVADHIAPLATYRGNTTDAMDYYSTWKLFDALTDWVFYEENKEYALGNTNEQRYMGSWSDGAPVKELVVTDNP